MKNILMMMLGVSLALGATASQPKLAAGGRIGGGPAKVVVVRPYAFYPYRFGYYNPYYSPLYGYNSFYYSPFAFQQRQPSKLDLEIEAITNDYHHEIAEVRHNKTLSRTERKEKIRDLRHERQNSIIEAKQQYYNRQEKDTE